MTRKMTSLRSLAAGSALLFLFVPTLYAAEQAAPEAPPVDARAWILMDYSSGHGEKLTRIHILSGVIMITLWGRNNSTNVKKVLWTLEELDLPLYPRWVSLTVLVRYYSSLLATR